LVVPGCGDVDVFFQSPCFFKQFLPVWKYHGGFTEIIIEGVLSALLLFTNGQLFFWLGL